MLYCDIWAIVKRFCEILIFFFKLFLSVSNMCVWRELLLPTLLFALRVSAKVKNSLFFLHIKYTTAGQMVFQYRYPIIFIQRVF